MKKRITAFCLAILLALGLVVPSMAATSDYQQASVTWNEATGYLTSSADIVSGVSASFVSATYSKTGGLGYTYTSTTPARYDSGSYLRVRGSMTFSFGGVSSGAKTLTNYHYYK